jgi:hypothetical protein
MSFIYVDAINSLRPGCTFISRGDKIEHWDEENPNTQPTEEEIVQEIAKLKYEEEVKVYQKQRAAEYPDWGTQLDYIYHNGVDAWKTDIVDPVKTAHPKQEIDETELASRKAQALFDYQLAEYTKAVARLEQYQVALGREEITEEQVVGQTYITETDTHEDVIETVVVSNAIDPVDPTVEIDVEDEETKTTEKQTIENPLITKDNEERANAQAVVDATPQEVIDAYNAL